VSADVYRTIAADPPWQPELGGNWGARVDKGRPQRFYGTMPLEDIKALEVPSAPQSHLYLWCLSQHVDWGYEVARAWGFEPVITLTWCKDGLGVGRFRCNTEHIVVGRKGSRHGNPFGGGGRSAQALPGTWFTWPRGRHSEKPAEFYAMAEEVSPAPRCNPRLEMFARVRRPGWDAWGNEVSSDVKIAGWVPAATAPPRPSLVPDGQESLFDLEAS
jgi:N6-adenosine-specific RNA methylase IME4